MLSTMPVWYIAYGSNLLSTRFELYLRGGQLAGHARRYAGCRSPRPPSGDRRVDLPHQLRFGGHSSTWGGGVAFVSPQRLDDDPTPGRAWRLEMGQMADLVAQENGREVLDPPPSWLDLAPGDSATVDSGSYGLLVRLDDVRGEPAFTVTTPAWPVEARQPTEAYVACVRDGLVEIGFSVEAAERRLADIVLG